MNIKKDLLLKSGKPLTTRAVSTRLKITENAVEALRSNNKLLGVPAKEYGHLYPALQFKEDSIVEGLDNVLFALKHVDCWMVLQALQLNFIGRTPTELLIQGHPGAALLAVRSYGEQRSL